MSTPAGGNMKQLTENDVWTNDRIMAINARANISMDLIMEFVRAFEAAQIHTAVVKATGNFKIPIEDHGIEVDESLWPAILSQTLNVAPVSSGAGTHCWNENYLIDGCEVSIVYEYGNYGPIEIRRYKPKGIK